MRLPLHRRGGNSARLLSCPDARTGGLQSYQRWNSIAAARWDLLWAPKLNPAGSLRTRSGEFGSGGTVSQQDKWLWWGDLWLCIHNSMLQSLLLNNRQARNAPICAYSRLPAESNSLQSCCRSSGGNSVLFWSDYEIAWFSWSSQSCTLKDRVNLSYLLFISHWPFSKDGHLHSCLLL